MNTPPPLSRLYFGTRREYRRERGPTGSMTRAYLYGIEEQGSIHCVGAKYSHVEA
jgi:hypothetical protein